MKTHLSLHWSAGTYTPSWLDRDHYHAVIGTDQNGEVYFEKNHNYTERLQGTYGRNSQVIDVAICAMAGAVSTNFGKFPITEEQIDELCLVAAEICILKGFPLHRVLTHAEWALIDGYGVFSGDPQTRWDLGLLKPGYLSFQTVKESGRTLRIKIKKYMDEIKTGKRLIRQEHSKSF